MTANASNQRVLLVDDEADLHELLLFNLQEAGFLARAESTAEAGLRTAASFRPDVVVLDVMLPDISGIEACRRLRADVLTEDVGVLMLTARGEEFDRVLGLEAGADDYVVKPFSVREVILRVRADRTRIERLETTRRDFVANVSHELRTPVTAIQGYAETLLRGTADPETARRFLDTMHRQAQRISALVTDLLRLSALEASDESPREMVPLGEVVREIAATARESRSDSVEVLVDVKSDLAVMGDLRGVEQIVENLVENALRYGARTVRLSASTREGRARLFVDDDGPGIAAEHLPRLFERFYRIESAPRALAGTGLGLAIVKHLAESMGGSVRVESEVGKGTKFTVELGLRESSGVSS